MASITYQEQKNAERMKKIRGMLHVLPSACSDFINSIATTTSVLTRMAYTIDLQTFCGYATKEIPYYAEKAPQDWTDIDWARFTARDLNGYTDYLMLYYKDEQIGETIEHHIAEGIFKAFARALRMAVKREPFSYELPSSKGLL